MEVDNHNSTKGVFPNYVDGHKSNILEEDKRINQSFTKTKNQTDVETAEAFETIKSHTTKNQSKLPSKSPEINQVVRKAHYNIHNSHRTKHSARMNINTSRNNPSVNINNTKDKNKIGIKTPNENYIEDSEKLDSNSIYNSEQNFEYTPTSKNTSTNVAELEKKSLTNNNKKERLPNIPTTKKNPNNDSSYSNHTSNKTRKRKIGEK